MPTRAPIGPQAQQPCVHCGDCVRACPEALDPEGLFFALVGDQWARARSGRLDACTECNRCVAVCPSHIPLVDWFLWGKSGLRQLAQADAARARFAARNARLAQRGTTRCGVAANPPQSPVQSISHAEVLAAIARGKARRRRGTRR